MAVFAKVYRTVVKNTVQAEIITFEDGALCFFLYIRDFVDGFLRNDKMAWNDDGNRVEPDCMSHCSDTGPVTA